MKQTLLVTGASGLVGSNILWQLRDRYKIIGTYYSNPFTIKGCQSEQLNINDSMQCKELFKKYKPNCVVHAAVGPKWRFVDCENNVNGQSESAIFGGTVNIVEACSEIDSKLIYISTDWVYNGDIPNGMKHSEDETPEPMCNYGIFKLKAEQFIAKKMNDFLVLRIANVYGYNYAKCMDGDLWDPKNVMRNSGAIQLIAQVRQGKTVKQPSNIIQNATLASDLAHTIVDLWQNDHKGVFNAGGHTPVSRYEFLRTMAKYFNFNIDLVQEGDVRDLVTSWCSEEVDISKLVQKIPLNTVMDLNKVEKAIHRPMLGYEQGLQDLLKQIQDIELKYKT